MYAHTYTYVYVHMYAYTQTHRHNTHTCTHVTYVYTHLAHEAIVSKRAMQRRPPPSLKWRLEGRSPPSLTGIWNFPRDFLMCPPLPPKQGQVKSVRKWG